MAHSGAYGPFEPIPLDVARRQGHGRPCLRTAPSKNRKCNAIHPHYDFGPVGRIPVGVTTSKTRGRGGGPGAACAATRPTPSVYARTINDLLKKLKRRLTWQWGQAGEDMLDEANNCDGCGVPRSESHSLAMYYRGLHRGHK